MPWTMLKTTKKLEDANLSLNKKKTTETPDIENSLGYLMASALQSKISEKILEYYDISKESVEEFKSLMKLAGFSVSPSKLETQKLLILLSIVSDIAYERGFEEGQSQLADSIRFMNTPDENFYEC